ncbi:MAG: flagellar protein FliS [bacterium]|nr:flagellar protein FliS [bacterium]
MSQYSAYKDNSLVHWTRVDMLLAIYNSAIGQIEQIGQTTDEAEQTTLRLKSVRLVTHLLAGLDLKQGEVPQRIEQLLEFTNHRLVEATPEADADALKILTMLRDAFEEIREEANELESRGEIPPLNTNSMVEQLA